MSLALRLSRRHALTLLALSPVFTGPAMAAPPINDLAAGLLGARTSFAILGYDPVAYFTLGKPVKGNEAFTHVWKGAKWLFVSAENRALFVADPERYAPQYGGYCAYGVARGYLVSIEPDKYAVIDGKLYLNYNADVQAKWSKDPARYITEANSRFPELLKTDP
ncbi:MAG: YHS domain-containing (seleno)protein [Labrys sp. (in: a-proteobacteria)]